MPYQYRVATNYPWTYGNSDLVTTRECDDMTHTRGPNGYTEGGPCYITHSYESANSFVLNGPLYVGHVRATWSPFGPTWLTGYPASTEAQMASAGTHSIAVSLPTNPASSMAVALGELKHDGIPHLLGAELWKGKTKLARSAGSEYLNYEFGWKPLVKDVLAFAKSVKEGSRIIQSYHKGSDKSIRVSRSDPAESNIQTANAPGYLYPQQPGVPSALWPGSFTRTISRKRWFIGHFRYHIPMGDDFISKVSRFEADANKLFGTRITPDVLWNLAPWSWAVDWFTSTGDVIHNISALGADGLVMQSGYQMESTEALSHQTITVDATGYGNGLSSGQLYRKSSVIVKQRAVADPYGFGVTNASLSDSQKAILVALGLSRGPR